MTAGKEEITMGGTFWECAEEDRDVNLVRTGGGVQKLTPASGSRPQRMACAEGRDGVKLYVSG